jgi:Flp pilus assembly protein TadB
MSEINVDSLLLNRKDVAAVAERRYWRTKTTKRFWIIFLAAVVVAAIIAWVTPEKTWLEYLTFVPVVPVVVWYMVLVRRGDKYIKEFVASWVAEYGDFPGGHGGHDVVSEG